MTGCSKAQVMEMPLESSGAPLHQLPPDASGHDKWIDQWVATQTVAWCVSQILHRGANEREVSIQSRIASPANKMSMIFTDVASIRQLQPLDNMSSISTISLAGQHSSNPRISSRPNSDSVLSGGSGKSSRQPGSGSLRRALAIVFWAVWGA